MKKIAVVYWSGTGNTATMADAVAAGAKKAGAEVRVLPANEFAEGDVASYDAFAFGCPAMGAETLEENEFEPMFLSCLPALNGKTVGLFGSYGWGDGEWMRTWEDTCRSGGVALVADGVICCSDPDDNAKAECEALGEKLAQ